MVSAARTAAKLMTAEEFARESTDDARRELWRGVVVEMSPTKPVHSRVGFRLQAMLSAFVMRTGIGEIWPPDSGFTIEVEPDTVVSPDLAFVPQEIADRYEEDGPGFAEYVPPLVVETKSLFDREKEIAAKLAMYLGAGVGEVWWVRPKQRTLTRHWPDRDPIVLGLGEMVADVEALPGFEMAVDDIFPPKRPAAQLSASPE